MYRVNVLVMIIFLFASAASRADLVVDEAIVVYGDPTKTKHDVTVYNNDEASNMYLEVTPFKVVNPGQDNQTLQSLSLESAPEFLVSPNRAIVAPGSLSMIRLLNLKNEGSEERVYRINLVPATPPLGLQSSNLEAVESMLQVVVAYQILVIVLPENPEVKVASDRLGRTASFANDGNANYLLTDGEQCNPLDPTVCQALESRRIYPGNNWSIELPFDGPASYTLRNHAGSSTLVF